MSESGLYAKQYAALALKQCEGSAEEAVFLLRAYRSTLKRSHYTNTVTTDEMRVVRRISAAFKDIPGGQMLGATYDYTHRLIHFERENEDAGELHRLFQHILEEQIPAAPKSISPCFRYAACRGLDGHLSGGQHTAV